MPLPDKHTMNWSLRKRANLGFASALIVLAAVGFVAYRSMDRLLLTADWMAQTQPVLDKLQRSLRLLMEAETSVRGYVTTGRDEYLEAYQPTLASLRANLVQLGSLTAKNPDRQEQLGRLDALIQERLAVFAKTIELRKQEDYQAASNVIESSQGKTLTDQIRALVAEMENDEREMLFLHSEAARFNAHIASKAMLWGSLLAAVLIVLAIAVISSDLTALQQSQEALARKAGELARANEDLEQTRRRQLRLKDEFLSHVSHELRTPLTATYQFVTLVQDGLAGDLTPQQREYLDVALRNMLQLRNMIDDLLEATRADAAKLVITPAPLRLGDLFDEAVETLGHLAVANNVELTAEVTPALPLVHADPFRVRQILTNLIQNGVKFTPANGKIHLTARVFEEDAEYVCVTVADTGCGIGPEDCQRIFDRLYQVTSSVDTGRKGLGLGLFICHELVTRQGGRIWVASQLGRGSRFSFTLPIHRLTGDQAESFAGAPPQTMLSLKPSAVLAFEARND